VELGCQNEKQNHAKNGNCIINCLRIGNNNIVDGLHNLRTKNRLVICVRLFYNNINNFHFDGVTK